MLFIKKSIDKRIALTEKKLAALKVAKQELEAKKAAKAAAKAAKAQVEADVAKSKIEAKKAPEVKKEKGKKGATATPVAAPTTSVVERRIK